jgi:hypothetical protein
MNYNSLQKLGGISIICGAFFLTLWTICWIFLLPSTEGMKDASLMILNSNWSWITSISFFGIIFMIFGFTSVYSKIFNKTGIIGLAGYIFIILAYIFQAAKVTWEHFIYPILASNANTIFMIKDRSFFLAPQIILFRYIADITIFIGVILFCISIIKSKDFNPLSAILIFAGAVLYGVGPIINVYLAIGGVIILSIGCTLLGLRMIKND